MDQDKEFYFKVSQIYYEHNDKFLEVNKEHVTALLKDESHTVDRASIFEHLKVGWYHKNQGNLFSYILRPVKCPLFEVKARELY